MKRLNLIGTLVVALALLAGAAVAQDFDPIRDADHVGYLDGQTSLFGRYDPTATGPHSDAEWGSRLEASELTLALVPATFDPLVDADFLGHTGYDPAAAAGAEAYAQCDASCGMACGSDCASHCGASCGSR